MNFLERIGSLWARWQLGRRELFAVDIRQALSFGGRALILLPSDPSLAEPAIRASERIAKWFDPVNVIWIGSGDETPSIPDTQLSFSAIPAAINRWGLPYAPLVKRIESLSPEVAIDLNPAFFQPTAYLCVVSGARLRIGFHAPSTGFFNLQFSWKDEGEEPVPLAEHYDRFITTLSHLRTASPG